MQAETGGIASVYDQALQELGVDQQRLLAIRHPEIRGFALRTLSQAIAFYQGRHIQKLAISYLPVNLLLLWIIGTVAVVSGDPLPLILAIASLLLANLFIVRTLARQDRLPIQQTRQNMDILSRRLYGCIFQACYAGQLDQVAGPLLSLRGKQKQGMAITAALQDFIVNCGKDRLRMIRQQDAEPACLVSNASRTSVIACLVVLELLSGLCSEDEINGNEHPTSDY